MNTQYLHSKAKAWHAGEASGHDFAHVARVVSNAEKILRAYPEADREVVIAAALLHDVADHKLIPPQKKAETLEMMRQWLVQAGAQQGQIDLVLLICTNLSFSTTQTNLPLPLEGLIVQDADRLDAIGAIGIARAFTYGGAHNREIYREGSKDNTISHFYEKLLLIKDRMNTRAGRRIARQRHRFLESFFRNFSRRCGCKRKKRSLPPQKKKRPALSRRPKS